MFEILTNLGIKVLAIPLALLAIVFSLLAIIYFQQMKKKIHYFKAPTLEELKFGEEIAKKIHESIWNKPLKEFERQVNTFVDEFNNSNRISSKANAWGYVGAAVVTIISLTILLLT